MRKTRQNIVSIIKRNRGISRLQVVDTGCFLVIYRLCRDGKSLNVGAREVIPDLESRPFSLSRKGPSPTPQIESGSPSSTKNENDKVTRNLEIKK